MVDEESPVRAVTRAVDVLLSLEGGPQSLARIAEATGLSKPTVHRLLATLSNRQLVIQNPATSDYMLGPGCLGIADAVLRGLGGLGLMAQDVLESLAESSAETIALYVPAGTQRVCVAQVPSPQPVRYTSAVGVARPLYTGSMGKILLAFTEDSDRRELFQRMKMIAITPATVTDRGQLDSQLAEARLKGYAISRGEQAAGVASVSAPVFAANGHIMAALSILGPDTRMNERIMTRLRPMVIAAASEISGKLGFSKPASGEKRQAAAV
jgi:IclR family transcriptional regulator, acetate operon repressor